MRLIDADKLEMSLNKEIDAARKRTEDCVGEIEYYRSEGELMAFIKSILMVKAIMCKDCQFFSAEDCVGRDYGMCHKTNQLMYADEFCNLGERRKDDDD